MAALPPLERLFRIQSNFLIGWGHPALAEAWTPTLRGEVERRLGSSGAGGARRRRAAVDAPAQHAILATLNPSALDNALRDIHEHALIFAMMGYSGWHPHGASINIHGGARGAGVEGIDAGLDQVRRRARPADDRE